MQYIQDSLPNFEKALAEAKQQGLDKKRQISKKYIRYTKMLQKCHNSKTLDLIMRERAVLMNRLSRAG